MQVLDARFKEGRGGDGRVTILVADEMDLLVTRRQQLLYNLFDWPTHRASRLVILGIANTLDSERLLPKISSRLGNNKVVFKPYTADQLKKIVCSRLEEAAESGTPPKDATNDVSNSATGAGEEKGSVRSGGHRARVQESGCRFGRRGASWSSAAALPSSPRRSPGGASTRKRRRGFSKRKRRRERRARACDAGRRSRRAASRRSTRRRW